MRPPIVVLCLGFLAGVLVLPPRASAQSIRLMEGKKPDPLALDWLVECEDPWHVTPDQFEKQIGKRKFVWQDPERTRARFDPEEFQLSLLEREIGETLVNFKNGKMASISISVLNKGDEDEIIDKSKFTETTSAIRKMMDSVSGAPEEQRKKHELVTKAEGAVWRNKKAMYIGEWLFLPMQKFEVDGWSWVIREHGEFVRLRVLPPNDMLGTQLKQAKATVSRPVLASRVKRDATSAVIQGLPMVDQGSKGYCAVASFERVLRYYGADVDMHDLANLAETYGGTSPQKMKDAVFKIAQKLGMRTREPFFMKERQFRSLLNDYDRAARKAEKQEIRIDLPRSTNPWDDIDTDTLKDVRTKSQDFLKFKQEVVSNIDKGIPVMWALQLGLFWEDGVEDSFEMNRFAVTVDTDADKEDVKKEEKEANRKKERMAEMRKKHPKRPPPGSMGGHMRLIIGYDKKEGVIYYTDSWGPGHEMKKLPLDLAFTATLALFIIEPQ